MRQAATVVAKASMKSMSKVVHPTQQLQKHLHCHDHHDDHDQPQQRYHHSHPLRLITCLSVANAAATFRQAEVLGSLLLHDGYCLFNPQGSDDRRWSWR